MTKYLHTPIAIIGGGPAGLMTAIEIGRRNVQAILIEPIKNPPDFPKANATTSRSMEHYRRLGFAHKVRAKALTEGYPDDITYLTRYTGTELARLKGKDLRNMDWRNTHTSRWPTAEPLARVQQMDVEAVMREELQQYSSITCLYEWQATEVDLDNGVAIITIAHVQTDEIKTIKAEYVVGADGPRSVVRSAMGVSYEGSSDLSRNFFGGKMMATYFHSAEFYQKTAKPSWQYWAVNPEQRALLCALRDDDTFVQHTQLTAGQEATESLAAQALNAAMGDDFNFEILGVKEWTAGFALVAEAMANNKQQPHAFLVGDAAHLFTPTGGQGYNTSVDDAVNLGWKLAAVCQRWGGERLLASYQSERRPIAVRNTQFARAMAESIGNLPVPDEIELASLAGESARQQLSDALLTHAQKEFDIPGITYGVWYNNSAIVVRDTNHSPVDSWNEYQPSSIPGVRAPHVWLDENTALQDLFGTDFTLLCSSQLAASEQQFIDKLSNMPLKVVTVSCAAVAEIYQFERVLIRPDHHIGWRGELVTGAFINVMAQVTGCGEANAANEVTI
jgi:2-polyprenyl-6-methoxyphenol hydroxylase-like FAD-dependent oxidoreductase